MGRRVPSDRLRHLAFALAVIAGAAFGSESAYRDPHPLELQALREPAVVLAALPAAYASAERDLDSREIARLALAEANACRVKADWFCQRRAAQRAAEAAAAAHDTYLEVRGLVLLARGLASMNNFNEANRTIGRASDTLGQLDAPELHADIALAYSTISSYLGKHEVSVDYATRGLRELPPGHSTPMRIRLLRNRANGLVELRRTDEAAEALREAEHLVERVDDPKLAGEILIAYGRLALTRGELDLADSLALRIEEQGNILRNSLLRGLGLELAGEVALRRGDTPRAEALLQSASHAFRSLDQYRDEYRVVLALAGLAARTQSDPALVAVLHRLDALTREVAERERQQAADDFEDRLRYLRQEVELTEANAQADADRLRAENADRVADYSAGIAAISLVALLAMAYLTVRVRRSELRLADVEQRRLQAMLRVSHDLRNPINGILGLCAALRASGLPVDTRASIDAVASAAHGLVALAQDLLDSGQLEAGKLRLEVRPVDLPLTLRNIGRQYQSRCRSVGLAFEIELDRHMPRRTSVDPDRLSQVLGNLLGNALKFTHTGSITLRTRVLRQSEQDATIEFAVIDTGPGICESERAQLMQPFEKGIAGKQHASGAGLGLAICASLLALMGSRLEVRSKQGEGATFHFTLSLPVLADTPSFRGDDYPPLPNSRTPAPLRVLVVDDDELNRQYHGLLLDSLSCQAVLAASAEQAMENARSDLFDAALIDYDMGSINGAELAAQLRELADASGRPIRLVMVSGHAPSRQLGSAQVDGWLLKPLTPQILREALQPSRD
jgi:signal transduction histidine kinase/CheY-like chemotaxis protein